MAPLTAPFFCFGFFFCGVFSSSCAFFFPFPFPLAFFADPCADSPGAFLFLRLVRLGLAAWSEWACQMGACADGTGRNHRGGNQRSLSFQKRDVPQRLKIHRMTREQRAL